MSGSDDHDLPPIPVADVEQARRTIETIMNERYPGHRFHIRERRPDERPGQITVYGGSVDESAA